MKVIKTVLGISILFLPALSMAMNVEIDDKSWDGKIVPEGQQCNRFGGKASTPPMLIKNLPEGTNLIVMSYSDIDAPSMNNGGHGVLAYAVNNAASKLNIPSVPGHTFELPKGFTTIQAHLAPNWDTAGTYMPPCSGGGGHKYVVKVEAYSVGIDKLTVLGTNVIELGKY